MRRKYTIKGMTNYFYPHAALAPVVFDMLQPYNPAEDANAERDPNHIRNREYARITVLRSPANDAGGYLIEVSHDVVRVSESMLAPFVEKVLEDNPGKSMEEAFAPYKEAAFAADPHCRYNQRQDEPWTEYIADIYLRATAPRARAKTKVYVVPNFVRGGVPGVMVRVLTANFTASEGAKRVLTRTLAIIQDDSTGEITVPAVYSPDAVMRALISESAAVASRGEEATEDMISTKLRYINRDFPGTPTLEIKPFDFLFELGIGDAIEQQESDWAAESLAVEAGVGQFTDVGVTLRSDGSLGECWAKAESGSDEALVTLELIHSAVAYVSHLNALAGKRAKELGWDTSWQ